MFAQKGGIHERKRHQSQKDNRTLHRNDRPVIVGRKGTRQALDFRKLIGRNTGAAAGRWSMHPPTLRTPGACVFIDFIVARVRAQAVIIGVLVCPPNTLRSAD